MAYLHHHLNNSYCHHQQLHQPSNNHNNASNKRETTILGHQHQVQSQGIIPKPIIAALPNIHQYPMFVQSQQPQQFRVGIDYGMKYDQNRNQMDWNWNKTGMNRKRKHIMIGSMKNNQLISNPNSLQFQLNQINQKLDNLTSMQSQTINDFKSIDQYLMNLQSKQQQNNQELEQKMALMMSSNSKKKAFESSSSSTLATNNEHNAYKSALMEFYEFVQNPKPRNISEQTLMALHRNKIVKLKKVLSQQYNDCQIETGKNKYFQFIVDFMELNKTNKDYPYYPLITRTTKQSEYVQVNDVLNHQRIPSLNGQKELRAIKDIPKYTVIGEYYGYEWLENDFDDIYSGTLNYFEVNEYAFNECVVAKVSTEFIAKMNKSFDENDIEEIDHYQEPLKKRRKLNKDEKETETEDENEDNDNLIKQQFNVIIDGWNMDRKSPLCFMNDCRKNIEIYQPTKNDLKHKNVEYVTIWKYGWPKIYAITINDIKAGNELLSYFGPMFSNAIKQRKRFESRQRMIGNKMTFLLNKTIAIQ